MVKNRFEGHFCTFLLFPKQPFSVSVFMTRSMPVTKITNPRILRAVKNQCSQRRKFLQQKVVRRFNPSLTFAARIVLSFKHRFFFREASRSDLPFSSKSDRKEKSVVSITHEQNIICNRTKLDDIAHEQTIISKQLFAGQVVRSRLIKKEKNLQQIICYSNVLKLCREFFINFR